MSKDNLIPLQDRPPEERRAIASAGGKASSRMQRGRKLIRDTLTDILSEPGRQEKVVEALVRQAENGSVRAFAQIAGVMGEGAVQRVEVGRMDEAQRAAFIQANQSLLIEAIRQGNETNEPTVADVLQLTYEERKQVIERAMEEAQRDNNGALADKLSIENGCGVTADTACELEE